ncbi:hypothetical protein V172_10255 [Citrobacter freundii RLS1]|jgi:hypothetical protein|nr:hypothetical protein V172_10255 [Citrobacter freundii RLS1]KEL79079.1 putative membrane protein [Citrobacter freundii]
MVYLIAFGRKKSPHCLGAGFFLCFLYASARTVTCGNGDGCGNSDADAFHDVVCSVIIICLSCILLGLKYLLT